MTRLFAAIAALFVMVSGVLGLALYFQGKSLDLARAEAKALRAERDQALGALARQNQAVARYEEEGKAQVQRMAAVVPRTQRRQVQTQTEIQSLQAAAVPASPEPALRWGAVEARRLALQWEEGARQ